VGVGALKPVNEATVELKRMYVRPIAQGHGVGRALLDHLLADAAQIGYSSVRLETLLFMNAAQALYRGHGFVETTPFAGSETAGSELHPITLFMALDLQPPANA
jgi:GNAT superfamily N-acetyltransferase